MKLRFEHFDDSELYILKRALIEATKWIYREEKITYSQEELDLFDRLLTEAIDNIKARDSINKDISRVSNTSSNEPKIERRE